MEKIRNLVILSFVMVLFITNSANAKVMSNEKIDKAKVDKASKIITGLQRDMQSFTKKGSGPFVAAIYDDKGNLIVKVANSVVNENNSNNHAEMNAIKEAEKKLGTYDLAPYNLRKSAIPKFFLLKAK